MTICGSSCPSMYAIYYLQIHTHLGTSTGDGTQRARFVFLLLAARSPFIATHGGTHTHRLHYPLKNKSASLSF
jgi:hypothetical protein